MTTAARKLVLYAIMIAIVAVVVEGMAALGLYLAEKSHAGLVRDLFIENHFSTIPPKYIENFRERTYHRQLGWYYRPGLSFRRLNKRGEPYEANYSHDGSRRHDLPPRALAVAAYGDSFTAGVEVNDNETWPYFLELKLGRGVKNFGSGGYGTDQAVLKFEDHAQSGVAVAPVTVLGIHEENIGRIVNSFRPFYLPSTGIRLGFKPTYRCQGDQGDLLLDPNPLKEFEDDRESLKRIAEEAAERDLYAGRMVRFTPPFLPKAIKLLIDLVRQRMSPEFRFSRSTEALWADPAVSHLMACIIEHFVELARHYRSTPVLLFLPKSGLPQDVGVAPAYAAFVERLMKRHPTMVIVDIAREHFDAARFLTVPGVGHTSAYGNQIIAEAIARAIGPLLPKERSS